MKLIREQEHFPYEDGLIKLGCSDWIQEDFVEIAEQSSSV